MQGPWAVLESALLESCQPMDGIIGGVEEYHSIEYYFKTMTANTIKSFRIPSHSTKFNN